MKAEREKEKEGWRRVPAILGVEGCQIIEGQPDGPSQTEMGG